MVTAHMHYRSTARLAPHSPLLFTIMLSAQESSAASHKCYFRVRHFGSIFELPYKKLGAGCSSLCHRSTLVNQACCDRTLAVMTVAARYCFASCRFACYRFARCRFARRLLAVALLAACFAHCCFASTSLPLCSSFACCRFARRMLCSLLLCSHFAATLPDIYMVWHIVDRSCSFNCAAQRLEAAVS